MNRILAVRLVIVLLITSSCGRESQTQIEDENTPEWEGKAQLLQEVVIGVGRESDEYYLGRPVGIAAYGDHIYILDNQVPILRMYDFQGNHVRDIGRIGQGPGEYQIPWALGISSADGTIFIREAMGGVLHEYSRTGEPLGIRRPALGQASLARTLHLKVLRTSIPYIRAQNYRRDQESKTGGYAVEMMVGVDPSGSFIDTLLVPEYLDQSYILTVDTPDGLTVSEWVPFSPRQIWTMSPSGSLIHGVSDTYRLEIVSPDRGVQTIQREIEPVPIKPDERRLYEQQIRFSFRNANSGWRWNARSTPQYKPYFSFVFADQSGRIWVLRQGPGSISQGDETWQDSNVFDVFREDTGRFLGEVEVPKGLQIFPEPFAENDLFLAHLMDQEGVPIVIRYRLVIPE